MLQRGKYMGRGRPYYQQMRDDIKKKIQCGDYKRGQYLPCEKKLEEEYGVSRTTVRSAISELVQDGYLYICLLYTSLCECNIETVYV